MILQMKQTTKFWKIGMGTFNKYLFMCLYLWAMTTKNKQTNLIFFLYKLRLSNLFYCLFHEIQKYTQHKYNITLTDER